MIRPKGSTALEIRSLPRIWPDSTVVILGSGPSVKDADLSLIWSHRVIAINHSFRLGPADMLWFGDLPWYQANERDINSFGGLKCTCCSALPEVPWPGIKRVRRSVKQWGIETERADAVAWNRNSGTSAINVAWHMGAKRVVLVGFDMKARRGKTHFHSYYGKDRKVKSYDKHLKAFPHVAEDAKRIGLEIVNCCADSAIEQFPVMTLEEALK